MPKNKEEEKLKRKIEDASSFTVYDKHNSIHYFLNKDPVERFKASNGY